MCTSQQVTGAFRSFKYSSIIDLGCISQTRTAVLQAIDKLCILNHQLRWSYKLNGSPLHTHVGSLSQHVDNTHARVLHSLERLDGQPYLVDGILQERLAAVQAHIGAVEST